MDLDVIADVDDNELREVQHRRGGGENDSGRNQFTIDLLVNPRFPKCARCLSVMS